jgi:hypothetical protein
MSFHYLQEDGSGALLLETGSSYYLLEQAAIVPNIVGTTLISAAAAMVGLGLSVTVQQANSSTVGAGLISSQNPAAQSEVPSNSNVIIVVSAGPTPTAGQGGDQWGANGGGQTAVNTDPKLGQQLATAAHPANTSYPVNQSAMSAMSTGTINQGTSDYLVPNTTKVG